MANTERIRLWVDALRSGDYKQGDGQLRARRTAGDEFCCLGVLCELAIKDGVTVTVDRREGTDYFLYEGQAGLLPREVIDWAGFDPDGDLEGDLDGFYDVALGVAGTAAELNDNGEPFANIADVIAHAFLSDKQVS